MTRIPTYANYVNMLNQTMKNKQQLDTYNYQAITGLKAQNYSGYGSSAFNIVSFEASLNVTQNFLDTNDILNIEVKAMNTAMDAVSKAIADFKSSLTSFSGMDLGNITPDYTGGELNFSSNDINDYLGKTLTIDGVKYTFANDSNGNNIDISGATTAEDIMTALKDKLPANPDFKFEGTKFTFPLYTVNGSSTVLNATGVTTGEPHTMSAEQSQEMANLQQQAFSTMLQLVDSLNVSANGKYLFGGGVSTEPPINFPFKTLDDFQQYYNGTSIKYPTSGNANLSNWSFTSKETGDLTLSRGAAGGNSGVIGAENAGAFLRESVIGGAQTTGDLTFNVDKNTVNATEYGAFNNLKAGDTMVIGGNDAGTNAKAYIIKSVSADGKTITFENSTPVQADLTVADGGDIKFSSSYPVGSVIDMSGFGNNISPQVQVTGISDDGTQLYVSVDPSRWPAAGAPQTIDASSKWEMQTSSYYKGGELSSEHLLSGNQSLTMDITASNPAFEKLFRALGEIAQGNMIDTRNPADEFDGLIDNSQTSQRIENGLDLIADGLYNKGMNNSKTNADLYTVMAKLNSNAVVLKSVIDSQTLVKKNLEDSISSLKDVDRTEAAAKALLAAGNLDASYAVINTAMSVSLLNYLK